MTSQTKAELLTENAKLKKRLASLERAKKKRATEATELKHLRAELLDAEQRHTATAEILKVIGIPPDKIGSLFTEFKQTDATIASEDGGTGLGLSISKKFIEMLGARVWVESEVGNGSSFIFGVPLRADKSAGAES